MKVLHIGKQGNMEKYAAADSFLLRLERVDLPRGLDVKDYLREAGDADVIVADAIVPVPGELIRSMPNLKLVHSEGVAFNLIDTAAADARGIYVCNCQGMNAGAVAEQTILLMLGVLRSAANGDRAVREGNQIRMKETYIREGSLMELRDMSIGLVGFGDIAKAVARLLQPFGVRSIFCFRRTPLTKDEEAEYGVAYVPLPVLLEKSDMVSLHLPVTADTREIADESFFKAMKEGSYLINTARGELVNDEALIRAMRCGKIAGAGLDTLDHEPVGKDHPLLNCPDIADRILFSPHIGGITASSFRRGYAMISEDAEAVCGGRRPKRVVNLRTV